MLNPGWDQNLWNTYLRLLQSPHQVRIGVTILNQQHQVIGDISHLLMDGAVDIDALASTTRSLKMKIADPVGWSGLDPYGTVDNMKKLIQINYGVQPMVGDTAFTSNVLYNMPIFTGPITSVSREGIMLNVECAGKEHMLSKASRGLSIPKGWSRPALFLLYAVGQGESQWVNEAPSTAYPPMPNPMTWEPGTNMWTELKALISADGLHAFYDGLGRLRMRRQPDQPVWQFNYDWLTQKVDPDLDLEAFVNNWQVIGGTPEGTSGRVRAEASLPAWHPGSPMNLSRNGSAPRYVTGITQDDSILNADQARWIAERNLFEASVAAYDVQMTTLVLPFLEEYDMYIINTPDYFGLGRFVQATIPLVGDIEMSVGFMSTSGKPVYGRYQSGIIERPVINEAKRKPKKKPKKKKNKSKGKKGEKGRSGALGGVE